MRGVVLGIRGWRGDWGVLMMGGERSGSVNWVGERSEVEICGDLKMSPLRGVLGLPWTKEIVDCIGSIDAN